MRFHSPLVLLGLLFALILTAPERVWASTDVDGDGKADLVWRHLVTGDVVVWLMDGLSQRAAAGVATVGDPGRQIVGFGDVDGDGRGDVVWHHGPTGQVEVWFMDGPRVRASAVVATVADHAWRTVGVGDIDGDGKADLVRQHSATGEVAVWLMDGVAIRDEVPVTTEADLRWRIAAVGDLDGDGKADVVRHHITTGDVAVWLLDGRGLRQDSVVSTIPDLGWQIVGIGDTDGDGRSDLVWRHTPTGHVGVWLMNGPILRQGSVVRTISDLGWEIDSVNDLDADGRADLVWRHTPSGAVAVWLMDGVAQRAAAVVLTVADLDWQLQPPRPPRGTTLEEGTPRTGAISSFGQTDLYEFVLDVPSRVIFQAASRAINPCVTVYPGTLLHPVAGGAACAADKSGKFVRLSLTLGAGRYLVTAHDAGHNDDGTYNIVMLPVIAGVGVPLAADEPQRGLISVIGDIDLYQFSVEGPARVVVEATRVSGGTGGISPCLELYTGAPAQPVPGGFVCADNTAAGWTGGLELELSAGTYFVAVSDAGHDGKGTYNVLMLPLTPATGTVLTPGVLHTGTIVDRGDVNVHQFALATTERVVLQAIRSSGGTTGINPCIELYSGNPAQPVAGGAVCAADTPITGRDARLDLTLSPGTYFAVVRDAGGAEDGDYDLVMLPLNAATSVSLGLGVPQAGSIDRVGATHLYQFALTSPSSVHVEVTRAARQSWVNPCVELYTGSPAHLVPGGAACASTKASGKTIAVDLALPAGTYFALVHDAGEDDVGEYAVVVSTP